MCACTHTFFIQLLFSEVSLPLPFLTWAFSVYTFLNGGIVEFPYATVLKVFAAGRKLKVATGIGVTAF